MTIEPWRDMSEEWQAAFVLMSAVQLERRLKQGNALYDSAVKGFQGDPIKHATHEAFDLLVYLCKITEMHDALRAENARLRDYSDEYAAEHFAKEAKALRVENEALRARVAELEAAILRALASPGQCLCEPVGSGEEWCLGHCYLAEVVVRETILEDNHDI